MWTLIRPLVWLDVETHDKKPPEESYVCELGFEMMRPDGSTKIWESYIKPPVPVAQSAIDVHGITNEQLADAKPFAHYAKNLAFGFSNCDFGGYNVKFDLRCIQTEMNRNGVKWSYEEAYLVDPLRMWQVKRPRSLSDAVREHLKREPSNAHRALADAQDAKDVGLAMLSIYELPVTPRELHELCFPPNPDSLDPDDKIVWNAQNDACINFGKYKDRPLAVIVPLDRRYFEWIVSANFSPKVKAIVQDALDGQFPKRTL